ncbi:AAA family ATPase [Fervidobacterium sp.]
MGSSVNPFKIGKTYCPENFIDRKEEYGYLVGAVESGNNVVVVAPRRFGKTWLLQKFIAECGYPVIYLDLFGCFSLKGFVQKVMKQAYELLKEKSPMNFVGRYLKHVAKHVSFSFDVGGVSFSIDNELSDELLIEQMYELLEGVQKDLEKRLVVVLDEFQAYKSISEKLPESLRSFYQVQKDVVFVFSGSMRHMIEELFFEESGALYHSCLRVDIGTMLPEEECVEYIVEKFNSTGKKIILENAKRIYGLTKGHPYFLQLLCYELWNKTEGVIGKEEIGVVFDSLCERESYGYELIIETLEYKYLKNVLKLISEQTGDYFSIASLQRYKIPNATTLNNLLKKLTQRGIVEKLGRGKYQIIDPLFESYVGKKLC